MASKVELCGTCKFYGDIPGQTLPEHGLCVRNPPQVVLMPQSRPDGQMGLFPAALRPTVHQSETCGEYRLDVMPKPPKLKLS